MLVHVPTDDAACRRALLVATDEHEWEQRAEGADIGPVVAFLLGDGARYLTGQTVVVDGSRVMGL